MSAAIVAIAPTGTARMTSSASMTAAPAMMKIPRNVMLMVGWTLFGFTIYFLYGYRHSKLAAQSRQGGKR